MHLLNNICYCTVNKNDINVAQQTQIHATVAREFDIAHCNEIETHTVQGINMESICCDKKKKIWMIREISMKLDYLGLLGLLGLFAVVTRETCGKLFSYAYKFLNKLSI